MPGPDEITLPFQGCPVAPSIVGGSKTVMSDGSNVSPDASPQPRPKRFSLFLKRPSSGSSTPKRGSYVGPQPTGIDGNPLKSCLKRPSDLSVRRPSDDATQHRVSFSHVQLRVYCRQVGDNPSVTSGCPLAIGWKFNKRRSIDIDTYEADRGGDPSPCPRVSSQERERILNEIGGISISKIMQGQVNAYYDRQLRAQTLEEIGGLKGFKNVGPRERLYIMRESAVRKFDRARKGTTTSKEQQKLWDAAQEVATQGVWRRSSHSV